MPTFEILYRYETHLWEIVIVSTRHLASSGKLSALDDLEPLRASSAHWIDAISRAFVPRIEITASGEETLRRATLGEQDTKFAKNIIRNWGRSTNPELAASNDAIFAQSKYYKISSVNVCASSMFARAHATESIHAQSDTLVQRKRIMTLHTCITTLHILIITQRTSGAHTHNDEHNITHTHHDTAHKWSTHASRHHTHAYHTITTV